MGETYKENRLPVFRRQVIDFFAEAWRSHSIRALFDVEIGPARQAIRRYRRETGLELSLSSYLLYCFVQALDCSRELQAHVKAGRSLVVFDDIDVSTIVERSVGGRRIPTVYVLREANRKSLAEIHAEIEAARTATGDSLFTTTASAKRSRAASAVALLPGFLRRRVLRYILRRNPLLKKRLFGTVSFSTVHMYGRGRAYGIPITPHPVHLMVGGISRQPALERGKLTEHEEISITLTLDHDVADGAPAARFVMDFKRRLRTADGLSTG